MICYFSQPLVRFKSHLYYEDKDASTEVDVKVVRPRSKIICFKNGVCQGVAYENIFEGTYYPTISLYKGSSVKLNFGPRFECPPALQDFTYKGVS
jgi:Set1/Ash2 histone methyltransferase complex subunit ASH2